MASVLVGVGALSALLSVAAGAFGAHGLKDRVGPDLLATWRTAAEYQMYHALGLILIGLLALLRPGPLLNAAAGCHLAGTVLFSGSLYLLVLSGTRWLGAITPLGGVCFLVGWLLVSLAAFKS